MEVDSYELMRSRMNDLPEDLLEDILVYWASQDEDAVWMACAVSKQWRRIVLGCPEAWSKIYVSLLPKQLVEEVDPEWCIEEDYLQWLASPRERPRPLALWAERAGDLTLTLSMRVGCTTPQIEEKLSGVLRAMKGHFSRCRHLVLTTDSSVFTDAVMAMLAQATTTWETIRVERESRLSGRDTASMSHEYYPVLSNIWKSLSPLSNLHTLSFSQCFPGLQEDNLVVISLLSKLAIEHVDCEPGHILHILSECTNLTDLRLSLRMKPPNTQHLAAEESDDALIPTPLPEYRLSLPSLTHLSLHKMTTEVCKVYLRYLHAPNLAHFALRNRGLMEIDSRIEQGEKTYDIMAPYGDEVLAFVSQTPNLRSFHIADSPLPDRHLLRVLGEMRGLVELELSLMDVGTLVFRRLARASSLSGSKEANSVLCPSLQRLRVIGCDFVSGSHLLDVIRARNSRRSSTVAISFLEVGNCSQVSSEDALELRHAGPPLFGICYHLD